MSFKDPDPLHLVGSPAFFPAFLNYIRSLSNSPSLPLDAVIIKSILLCIVAGDKNLILRTPEEDIGAVVKLVVWTLSYIFNYPTQKVRLRSYSSNISPAAFLRSIFLSSGHPYGSEEDVHKTSLRVTGGLHPTKLSRSTSRGRLTSEHARSISYPNDLSQVHSTSHSTQPRTLPVFVPPPPPSYPPESNHSKFQFPAGGTSEPDAYRPRTAPHTTSPRLQHSYTDPAPTRDTHFRGNDSTSSMMHDNSKSLELPHALVLSGLEKAGEPLQRALVGLLSNKHITAAELNLDERSRRDARTAYPYGASGQEDDGPGVWTLPPGFISIYVCRIDTKERPAIHRSLLDMFAMSHNILVAKSVQYSLRSLTSTLHHGGYSISHSNPGSPAFAGNSPLPQTQAQTFTPPYFSKPVTLPPHSPQPFTRHRNLSSSSSATPASAPLPENPILPQRFVQTLKWYYQKTYLAPRLEIYLSDLFAAARHHPRLDGMLLTAAARKDAESLARAARVIGADLTGMELVRPPGHLIKDEHGHEHVGEGDDVSEYYDPSNLTNSPGRHNAHLYRGNNYLGVEESSRTHLLRKESSVFPSNVSNVHSGVSTTRDFGIHVVPESDEDGAAKAKKEREEMMALVEVLDVTEADVARVMPRVVTHRLRLRSGPEEEVLASAVFGATFGQGFPVAAEDGGDRDGDELNGHGGGYAYDDDMGIKDILVDILNKV
ncbi:hypothetical protein FA15DRAFT_672886 [Coprinopsis marcescibilis]|uniref:Uncharacterized protein n=1 Tax=Coprinopsis marcescibilis TaxID=230819 RepID=A0A5C3KML3_COPMA|nr:hypothetical protein FA15DRAFT_672886 [Coprinopsis marcescibilis]